MTQQTNNPVGKSVPRVDAFEKVTGAAKYVDDMAFGPGLLYGKIVHSPVAHALIKKIDTSKALALPGVKAVVTGQDNPTHLGLYLKDRYIFAFDRVRYVGESVAGVVATSEEIAEAAAKLVEVEYELLEPVFDPYAGAQPGAPLIHPDLGNYEHVNFIFPEPGTNISEHFKLRKGDVSDAGVNDAVWAQCAAIVEETYTLPQIQHAPIETHVAVARWDLDGQITLWAASQSPFAQRDLLSNSTRRAARQHPRDFALRRRRLRRQGRHLDRGQRRADGAGRQRPPGQGADDARGGVRRHQRAPEPRRQVQDRLRRRGQSAGDGSHLLFRRRRVQRLRRQHRARGRLFLHRPLRRAARQRRLVLRLHQPSHRQRHARLRDARNPLGHRAGDGQTGGENRHGCGGLQTAQLRPHRRYDFDRHDDAAGGSGHVH